MPPSLVKQTWFIGVAKSTIFMPATRNTRSRGRWRRTSPHSYPAVGSHTVVDGMQQDLSKLRYLNFAELAALLLPRQPAWWVRVSARIFGIAQTTILPR